MESFKNSKEQIIIYCMDCNIGQESTKEIVKMEAAIIELKKFIANGLNWVELRRTDDFLIAFDSMENLRYSNLYEDYVRYCNRIGRDCKNEIGDLIN